MSTTAPNGHLEKVGDVTDLLRKLNKSTETLLTFFTSQNLPEPSYNDGDHLDPSKPLPLEIQAAKDAALEASDELHHLLLGPLGLLLSAPGDIYLMTALQFIYRYKIASLVPKSGSISFEEIASSCKLRLADFQRFIRVAIARHVFQEPQIGHIAHTAASRLLLNNALLEAWILNIGDWFTPSLTRIVDATEKWPGSEEPNETGYSLSHGTNENPFDVIKKHPARQQQFVDAMTFSHLHSAFSVDHLINNYDFAQFGSGTIVDVGGSHGLVSIAIAQKFPAVKCIVQDLPDSIVGLNQHIPADLKDRISGMEYDFFTPQPVKDADAYLFRWILHDWSDKYSVKILQSLIPAMKPGAKIIINDICIPEPGQLGVFADRNLRLMDISMKAFNNARERDPTIWASLFAQADHRFILKDIIMPPEARMAIIVAEWQG